MKFKNTQISNFFIFYTCYFFLFFDFVKSTQSLYFIKKFEFKKKNLGFKTKQRQLIVVFDLNNQTQFKVCFFCLFTLSQEIEDIQHFVVDKVKHLRNYSMNIHSLRVAFNSIKFLLFFS